MTRTVFIDSETSSLRPDRQIWDLAIIVRDEDGEDHEKQWFFDVSLEEADPFSLDIGHYWERHPNPHRSVHPLIVASKHRLDDYYRVLTELSQDLHKALVVGAVPWFDMETLSRDMREYGLMPSWRYHLADIEAMAAGKLGWAPPWDFDKVLAEFELAQGEDRHTALGDARLVRTLYDRVLGTEKE